MKGDPRNGRAGLAGVLARQRREWLSRDEVIAEIRAYTAGTDRQAAAILDSMKAAGLLIENSRYQGGGYIDVLILPYQRFSDHLVARHLLDAFLDTSSTAHVRRCFHKNQRLGAVFLLDRWGNEFAEPGIASALMIEFPERVRRMAERECAPTELLAYLPKARRLVRPVVDVFLEGLYWRPSSSFSRDTEWMVEFLLNRPEQELRARSYEVVVGLALRDGHPLGSKWLTERLANMSMPDRDVEWSEFVRTAEPDSNSVCMRVWAVNGPRADFHEELTRLARVLLEQVLRPGAPHSTWHALTRGYAIGVLNVLRKLRPRFFSPSDRALLVPAPGHAVSPFRSVSRIRKRDIEDPERAIHMDFGNYTIGRLVDGRGNYDFQHKEYVGVRRQIADRMRRLGYSTDRFNELDKIIVRNLEYRRDGYRVDRYGKKYSWIAYFEMYGLRRAQGEFKDEYFHEPRPSDSDVDPSFPVDIPMWRPPHTDVFAGSPKDLNGWIANGQGPDYTSILRLSEVDGVAGDWILLDASIHEGADDGRETRGWVSAVFVPLRSIDRLRKEVHSGREFGDRGFPDSGADYYTYHGEVPWSENFGSDVRTERGMPRHLNDRAFDYFEHGWRRGIAVEDACRRWSWEDYHSQLNQVGGVVFPAPPIAEALHLRIARGSSDMLDEKGRLATVFRRADGPGFGSCFLYMRRDLVQRYEAQRNLRLVQAIVAERNLSYRATDRGISDSLRKVFQSRAQVTERVFGLEE
jgi:hypothetical protein